MQLGPAALLLLLHLLSFIRVHHSQSSPDLMFLRGRLGQGEVGDMVSGRAVFSNRAKKVLSCYRFEAAVGVLGSGLLKLARAWIPRHTWQGLLSVRKLSSSSSIFLL